MLIRMNNTKNTFSVYVFNTRGVNGGKCMTKTENQKFISFFFFIFDYFHECIFKFMVEGKYKRKKQMKNQPSTEKRTTLANGKAKQPNQQ